MKKYGEQSRMEWERAWKRYTDARKIAKTVINSKIGKWEEEQARKLNNMPRRDREREGWKRLRRNLVDREGEQIVTLAVQGRHTTDEEEIRSVVEGYWNKIIYREKGEEPLEQATIYSDRKALESMEKQEEQMV